MPQWKDYVSSVAFHVLKQNLCVTGGDQPYLVAITLRGQTDLSMQVTVLEQRREEEGAGPYSSQVQLLWKTMCIQSTNLLAAPAWWNFVWEMWPWLSRTTWNHGLPHGWRLLNELPASPRICIRGTVRYDMCQSKAHKTGTWNLEIKWVTKITRMSSSSS